MPIPSLNALANRLEAISGRLCRHLRHRSGRGDWFLLKVQEEMGEMTLAWLTRTGRSRRDKSRWSGTAPGRSCRRCLPAPVIRPRRRYRS